VIGSATPGTTLSWGGTDGHPYDNGAIGQARWDLDGTRTTGDWRYYYVDVASLTNWTTWVMVNVTWMDPDTIIDLYVDLGHFGNPVYLTALGEGAVESQTSYLSNGQWDSTPSWPQQNAIIFDYFLMSFGLRFGSDLTRDNSPQPPIIISVHCVQRGGMYPVENITISVSPTQYDLDPYTPWFGPSLPPSVGYVNETSTGAAVPDDSRWSGEHITFNGTVEPWGFNALPVHHMYTDLQVLLGDAWIENAIFTAANYSTDAYFDIPGVVPGMLIVVETDATEVGGPGPGVPSDNDLYLEDPNGATVALSGGATSHESLDHTASMAGTYRVRVHYWGSALGGGVWGGWDHLAFWVDISAKIAIENPSPPGARTALWDTHSLGANMAVDMGLKIITGTSIDQTQALVTTRTNVSVENFFVPVLSLLNPVAGDVRGPEPFWFNWTASDQNSDEVLGFSVEVSNDGGLNWTLIVPGTLEMAALWDPYGFYGLNATDQMQFRVNCSDGMFIVSQTSGTFTVVELVPPPPPPAYELMVVIAVIVIVIIILLMTCILKRRQVSKT
jgi:hypothetical protein